MSTAFGIFELGQVRDQRERLQAINDVLVTSALAEELGYATMWLAEHHFSNYGVVGATQVLAAAVAARTERIGIGSAVTVVPFNHPLRTAEDFALVDILSNGRMKFGAGRAYQPAEFAGLGVPMDRSREIFEECMDIIELAWAQDTIEYNGSYFQIPETLVLPKPIRKRPPIYMAAVTAPSFDMAIKKGWNMQLATPFSFRLYREEWLAEVEKSVTTVNEGFRERGLDPNGIERALVLPFYVAPTKAQARTDFNEHLEWFYNRVTDLSSTKAVGGPEKVVAGYEQSMREAARTQELDLLHYDTLVGVDAVVAGDPDYCVERLREIRDRLGITEFMCFTNLGGLPSEKLHASMRLAAAEVLPHV